MMKTGKSCLRRYEPGSIVEVIFPFEEGNGSKRRPALVVMDKGDVILLVAKITSQNKGRQWDVQLPRDRFNGLSVDSFVQVDKAIKLSRDKVCDLIPRGCVNPLQFAVIMEKLKEFGKSRTEKR